MDGIGHAFGSVEVQGGHQSDLKEHLDKVPKKSLQSLDFPQGRFELSQGTAVNGTKHKGNQYRAGMRSTDCGGWNADGMLKSAGFRMLTVPFIVCSF